MQVISKNAHASMRYDKKSTRFWRMWWHGAFAVQPGEYIPLVVSMVNLLRPTPTGPPFAGNRLQVVSSFLKRNILTFYISFVCIRLGFIQPQTKLVIGTLSRLKVAVHDFQGRLESPMAVSQIGQLLPLQKVL